MKRRIARQRGNAFGRLETRGESREENAFKEWEVNLRLLWPPKLFSNVRTAELHAQGAFEFAENLRVRDGLAGFVVLDDGRFLVHFLSEILL